SLSGKRPRVRAAPGGWAASVPEFTASHCWLLKITVSRGTRWARCASGRGAQSDSRPVRGGGAEVAAGPRERGEPAVQRVLVHDHRAVVDDLADAACRPREADRRGPRPPQG